MRRRIMIWLGILFGLWVAVVAAMWLLQDSMVFPGAGRGDRALDDPTAVEVVSLRTADGVAFRAAIATPDRCRGVLAFFVGNGEDLRGAARWAAMLRRYDLQVIAAEYPGYGLSAGRPTVASLLAVAEATGRCAQQRAQQLAVPFLVGGSSIGTFCAVHAAALLQPERLLLRAPPTTMVAAASARFWWLPVSLLLRHRFDSLAVIGRVRCPVLIVHGETDAIVPLALGRELAAACSPPATLVSVPGYGHNDLPLEPEGPVGAALQQFLQIR